MTNSASTLLESHAQSSIQLCADSQIWDSLKQAIATSSGFQRWQFEQDMADRSADNNLDGQIRCYLRETLATLAY